MPLPLDPQHPSNHAKTAKNPLDVFRDLPDPREARNQLHKLFDIFAIAICAALCGANDWVKVAAFGHKKEQWLRTFLDLPNGIPSHDTFDRVFRLVDPNEFEKRFVKWTELVADLLPGQVIAIDGKTLRGSHDNAGGLAAIHWDGACNPAISSFSRNIGDMRVIYEGFSFNSFHQIAGLQA